MHKNLFSVSSKILFLTCSITILTAAMIGMMFYPQVEKIILERELNELSFEARSMEPQFQNAFGMLRNDASVLSSLPPIQGLVRSIQNGDVDPIDGSTTQIWRERLETIFVSVIKERPDYVQIRYIGVADQGRELVRVNQNGDIEVVAEKDLQRKNQEPYFEIAKTIPPGRVYYSPVNLNREHGKIQTPYFPVIRAVTPVYDNNNKLFGIIVINAAYDRLIKNALGRLDPQKDIYIVNEDGDYAALKKGEKAIIFKFNEIEKNSLNDPIINAALQGRKENATIFKNIGGEEYAIQHHKLFFDPLNQNRYVAFILSASKDDLLQSAYRIRFYSFLLGAALIIFSSLSSVLLARSLKAPLKKIIADMKAYGRGEKELSLPVSRLDEIGEVAATFQDLTQKLERSVKSERRALRYLETTLDTVIDGIITIDDQGIVQSFNPSAERIFGYQSSEVIGKNVKMLMPDPYHAEHDKYLSNYMKTGEKKFIAVGRDVEAKRKDGTVFPMGLGVNEMVVEGKKMFVGSLRDITQDKKAEEEIVRSNTELERFAYLASHDLQEPLRMITNFTALLQRDYTSQMDEKAQRYMGFVTDGAQRMSSLISDLLEYSRVGSEDSGFQTFNSQSQLNTVLENLKVPIEETGAKITFDPMPEIHANPVRFSSLIQNLVGNALKYRDKERAPEIHIGVEDRPEQWLFSVQDNGIGIKEEYKDQIFVIFKRLHSKKEYSGTGVGLSICKKIVESLEGKIWVESETGKGSTFFFTIPKPQKLQTAA